MLGFVHINKTAGTSVKFILRSSFGIHHCDVVTRNADGVFTEDELRFAQRIFPGIWSISGHPIRHPSLHLPAGIGWFAFLRDPLERAASHFQHFGHEGWETRRKYRENPGSRPPNLEEFLASPRFRNLQTRRIAGSEDVELAKREIQSRYLMLGLTERFEDSIRMLAKLSPRPMDLRYRRLKVAPKKDVSRRLLGDPMLRKELEEANQADQALYEWARDQWFPHQLERVGDLSQHRMREIARPTLRYQLSRGWNRAVYQLALRARGRLRRLPPT